MVSACTAPLPAPEEFDAVVLSRRQGKGAQQVEPRMLQYWHIIPSSSRWNDRSRETRVAGSGRGNTASRPVNAVVDPLEGTLSKPSPIRSVGRRRTAAGSSCRRSRRWQVC